MARDNKQSITQATHGDANRLAAMVRRSFTDVARRFDLTPQNCPKHPSNCTREWIEKDLARGVSYFILNEEAKSVGCVGVERASESICYMERLAVLPDYRSNGYGTCLVRHAIDRAGELGVSNLGIGIIAADTGLKHFYQSLGFEAGETKNFPHLPFEVAFMNLSL